MEKLDFKFPEEDFENIPTTDFHGFQQQEENYHENMLQPEIFYHEEKYENTEKLDFSLHPNKENISFINKKKEDSNKTLKKIKFDLANLKGSPKKLLTSLSKKSKKQKQAPKPNKFIKPFINKKKPTQIIRKEWNDDVKTPGVFQKVESLQVNQEKIKNRNSSKSKEKTNNMKSKEENDRKKYQTYQSVKKLEESLQNELGQRKQLIKPLNAKKQKIKEIETEIEKEKHKQEIIYERFSQNLKQFQAKKNKKTETTTTSQKKQRNNPLRSDNLLEIENYSPPKQPFADSDSFPTHENFQKQLELQRDNIKYTNYNLLNKNEEEFDNIPTRENGDRNNFSSEKKQKIGQVHFRSINKSSTNENIQTLISKNEKERLLNEMIEKHRRENEKKQYNSHNNEIKKKIDNIKHEIEPILKTLSKTKEFSNYPFTYNLLSKACIKSVCINSEKITELIIDEILFEMVGILNEIEKNECSKEENNKKKIVLDDFVEAIKDLQYEQDEILNHRNKFFTKQIREIEYSENVISLEKKNYIKIIEFNEEKTNKILNDKLKLDTLLNNKSLSDKQFVNKTKDISERLITEIFEEMYEEFEKVQDEFVEKIYHQEFFQK